MLHVWAYLLAFESFDQLFQIRQSGLFSAIYFIDRVYVSPCTWWKVRKWVTKINEDLVPVLQLQPRRERSPIHKYLKCNKCHEKSMNKKLRKTHAESILPGRVRESKRDLTFKLGFTGYVGVSKVDGEWEPKPSHRKNMRWPSRVNLDGQSCKSR